MGTGPPASVCDAPSGPPESDSVAGVCDAPSELPPASGLPLGVVGEMPVPEDLLVLEHPASSKAVPSATANHESCLCVTSTPQE